MELLVSGPPLAGAQKTQKRETEEQSGVRSSFLCFKPYSAPAVEQGPHSTNKVHPHPI